MILLVTQSRSAHADLVSQELEALDADHFRLDVDRFLRDYTLDLRLPGSSSLARTDNTSSTSLDQIEVVWWFDFPEQSVDSLGIAKTYIPWVKYETGKGLYWALSSLQAIYVNHPDAMDTASVKLRQLRIASKCGFAVPESILSNSSAAIHDFITNVDDCALFKTIAPISRERASKTRVVYATRVTRSDLDDASVDVKLNLFQRFVPKHGDIRVVVIGSRCLATYIDSQASERTQVDWRRYDFKRVAHQKYDLPEHIEKQCIQVVRELGLHYGAIDLVDGKDGRIYFLEVNAAGLWLWLEGLAGVPIAKTLASYLVECSAMPSSRMRTP